MFSDARGMEKPVKCGFISTEDSPGKSIGAEKANHVVPTGKSPKSVKTKMAEFGGRDSQSNVCERSGST